MHSILRVSKSIEEELIQNRRYLHQHPEIGLKLPKTSQYVYDQLKSYDLEPERITESGIIVNIGKGSPVLLLRADMDGLPAKENTSLVFKSKNMNGHLCGHDLHTSILLGVARLLKNHENKLQGTVKLMFQPAEETGAGALSMIEAGLLKNPVVDAALALHVTPDLEVGKFQYKPGIASASMDTFNVKVQGKGGHSSTPHLAIDPLMIVNSIYNQLNSLVSKEINPFETTILTIGKMGGGEASNIIPDTAILEGGVRCFNEEVRSFIVKRIHEIIEDTTRSLRGTYTIEDISVPSIFNNEGFCNEISKYLTEVVGGSNISKSSKPLSGTEDFSFISQQVPAMYIWAGADAHDDYPLHNPNVVFNEEAMVYGTAIMTNAAIQWLKNN